MAGAKAARENGIKELSTFPALVQVQNPTWVQSHCGNVESIFNQTAANNVLHLRPGYHGEFSEQVEAIQRRRTLYFPASNHDIPWISTDDIGDEAAKYLLTMIGQASGLVI